VTAAACWVVAPAPIMRLEPFPGSSWSNPDEIPRAHPCGLPCGQTKRPPLFPLRRGSRRQGSKHCLGFSLCLSLSLSLSLSLKPLLSLSPKRAEHEPLVDPDGLATAHAPQGHHPRRQRVGASDLSPFNLKLSDGFTLLTFFLRSRVGKTSLMNQYPAIRFAKD
jgi:hypothetical protein